jgi:hypothetical protein
MLIRSAVVSVTLLFVLVSVCTSQTGEKVLRYGLEFGMKKKEAKKILEATGYGEVKELSDSKEIDNIEIEGSVVEGFDNEENTETQSELEFYEGRLMSAMVSYVAGDVFAQKRLEGKYVGELKGKYGEPGSRESVMGIGTWIWEKGGYKILFSSNSRKNKVQLTYMYLPLVAKKYQQELKIKLKGKPPDVGKETFLK